MNQNNKKFFASDNFQSNYEELYNELLSLAKINNYNNIFFKKLFKQLVPELVLDSLDKDYKKEIYQICVTTLDFLLHRKLNEAKLEIILKEDENHCLIKILDNNNPYFVKALKYLFDRMELIGVRLNYFTFKTIRDYQGNLIDFGEELLSDYKFESMILVRLDYSDKDLLGSIEAEIRGLLTQSSEVALASQDMLYQIENLLLTYQKFSSKESVLGSYNPQASLEDICEFLTWIANDNFHLLSLITYNASLNPLSKSHEILLRLGGFTSEQAALDKEIYDIIDYANKRDSELLLFGESEQKAYVIGEDKQSYILIKNIDIEGNYLGGVIIYGVYSDNIKHMTIEEIPLLKNKLLFVLQSFNALPVPYKRKLIYKIFENLPTKLLFELDFETLTQIIKMALHSSDLAEASFLGFTEDKYFRVIITTPPLANPHIAEKMRDYLNELFECKEIEFYFTALDQDIFIIYASYYIGNLKLENILPEKICTYVDSIAISWDKALLEALKNKSEDYYLKVINNKSFFPEIYKKKFSLLETLEDLEYIKNISEGSTIAFNLLTNLENLSDYKLKIYSLNRKLILSDIVPYIENLGFKILEEESYFLSEKVDNIWIHNFNLELNTQSLNKKYLKESVEETLSKMFTGEITNSSIFKLISLAELSWREVFFLQALTQYLRQTSFDLSDIYVQETLIRHKAFAKKLFQLFDSKFNPQNNYPINYELHHNELVQYLNEVTNNNEDKVLKSLLILIEALVRTNFYQLREGKLHNYLSFKFNSKKIPFIPLPAPYAEIFVFAKDFEALHLRGGKVARGGIRWSDRGEDYRSEILGLMKAQMKKNPVIVPVGAKGGFFVKFSQDNLSPHDYIKKVVNCYNNFLRGLLDLTDNFVHNQIIHPLNTVIYDEDDPYLVVAADKGTATFSDFANSISKEYNFWLGDAFASGGSAGYDHKKLAITARGAWIAAKRHFLEKNIDIDKETITMIGIGDMSGDVFGNGLLQSRLVKLIGAFNHAHIFIDPNPDPEISYQERQRLFALSGSKWTDYTAELISEGGGVFSRNAKKIIISKQVQELLDIPYLEVVPEELIKYLLKSRADLLWNGGIGTYIKASTESHSSIGDKSNDAVRVNANELQVKVIAEGGNLGVSQLGRIEFARNGGSINTDFIDNSAGVDCSDHEVNIKIAMDIVLEEKLCTPEERDRLLKEMSSQVSDLVLENNFKQTQALSLKVFSTAFTTEIFAKFMDYLSSTISLDRRIEFLPSKAEMEKFTKNNITLTRPEFALLLSYGKMAIYQELLSSKLVEEKFFEKYLIEYFPQLMRERFKDQLLKHSLRHEIIITTITNKLVNQLGASIVVSIKQETGAELCDIVRAYTIIIEIFDLEKLWKQVENLSGKIDFSLQIDMFTEINKLIRRGIFWLIRNLEHPLDITKIINNYSSPVSLLSKKINYYLVGEAAQRFNEKQEDLKGLSEELPVEIAKLNNLVSVLDIILISEATNTSLELTAKLYFEIGEYFHLDLLRKESDKHMGSGYWQRIAVQSIKDDIYEKHRRLVKTVCRDLNENEEKIDILNAIDNTRMQDFDLLSVWHKAQSKHAKIYNNFIQELRGSNSIELNMLIIAIKKLEIFLQNL